MIETLKTLALVLLITGSLFQSYLLAYSSPNIDPILQSDYVQTETLGMKTELVNLLFPDQIVVHMGNGQHSVLYPSSNSYVSLLDSIKDRKLEGFRKTSPSLVPINWEDVKNKEQGIEIRLKEGVPINVLQNLLQIKGELPVDNDIITRIWIFKNGDKEDIRTFLFTDAPSVIYEVTKADFTSKDVEKFVFNYGSMLDLYLPGNGDYYLPTKRIQAKAYTLNYKEFTAEQLKRTLFVDPGITRNLKERDGSEIYTDAKRGLQINKDQRWFSYSDPVAAVETKNDVSENLLAGVQFVNQHGGWDGSYAVARTPQRQSFTNQTFIFRQYFESFPIVNAKPEEGFGTIKLVVQKGTVSVYERSMVIPDVKSAKSSNVELVSAAELAERLKDHPKAASIFSIFPAYRPTIKDDELVLTPVWALEFRDGTLDFIQ